MLNFDGFCNIVIASIWIML